MNNRKSRTNDFDIQLLGESPGYHHSKISGSKLPTYKQVLLCYLANMNTLNLKMTGKREKIKVCAMKIVIEEVVQHYKKAGIPIKSNSNIRYNIDNLIKKYKNCTKHKTRKPTLDFINNTMPFWPVNVRKQMEDKLKNNFLSPGEREAVETDLRYLESMISDRVATYSGRDMNHLRRKINLRSRDSAEKNRKELENTRTVDAASTSGLQAVSDISSEDSSDDDNLLSSPES